MFSIKNIFLKLTISIVIAGAVSGSLVFFTINSLKNDLILKNQVNLGDFSKQLAHRVSLYAQKRKSDLKLMGNSLLANNFNIESIFQTPRPPKNDILKKLNSFESDFIKDRFSRFYLVNNQFEIIFGFEKNLDKSADKYYGTNLFERFNLHDKNTISLLKSKEFYDGVGAFINISRSGYALSSFITGSKVALNSKESVYLIGISNQDDFPELLFENRRDNFDSIFLVDFNCRILVHTRFDYQTKNCEDYTWIKNRIIERGGAEVFYENNKQYLIAGTVIESLNSILCVTVPFLKFVGDLDRIKNIVYLVGTAFFLITLAIMIFIVQLITIGQREKLIAESQRMRALQEKEYSVSLEEKNIELSKINLALEDLHGEVKSEKEKIESIVNSIDDMIIMVDSDFSVKYINRYAMEILQLKESVKNIHISQIYSMAWMTNHIIELFKQKKSIYNKEKSVLLENNKQIIFECSFIYIDSIFKKKNIACLAVCRDVTKSREFDRMQTEFISTVSHELRTPMAAVRGTIELMLAGTLGSINSEQKKFLNIMLEETNRLVRLINNILDLRKAEAKHLVLNKDKINLSQIVLELIDIIEPEATKKKLKITYEMPLEVIILTDEDKIKQVILNLLNNAVKFTDAGNISIRLFLNSASKNVFIEISDTGRGIESSLYNRIFDKFFQADLNLTRKSGGTGLGLAITKELLRTLKGKINVESKINQGSKFIVELMDCLISFDKKKCSEDEVNNRKSKSISEKKNSYVCDSQLDLKENEFFSFQNGLSVLVIDDDHSMCSIVSAIIEEAGFTPLVSNSLEDAFELLSCNLPFLTILDLSFPSGSGIDYIEGIKKTCPSTFLLILTGDDKAFSAAQAFKNGAQEYMIKPFKKEDLQKIVFDSYKLFKQKFSESQSFVDIKESEFNHYFDSSLIIGKSIEAENLKQIIEKVSCSDETVLITGESGSGKEVAARVIHMNSYRSGGPFMAINCGALSEKILESELFGHVKGSFTGAAFDKKGLFESAKGGTLFLDEIGEAPEKVQIKLLRVLQEKQVLPVGAVRAVDIDVRVLAATNRNIEDMVKEKKFRQDLFYRLDVLRIKIPPLRVRKDDICELVKNIIKRYSEKYGVIDAGPDFINILSDYDWPGNIRELENVVKKSLLNAENKILTVNDLPLDFRKINMVKELSKNISGDYKTEKNHMIDIFDKIFLKNQLLKTNGNVKKAAELSNMHTKNFYMKIKKAGIDPLVYKKDE